MLEDGFKAMPRVFLRFSVDGVYVTLCQRVHENFTYGPTERVELSRNKRVKVPIGEAEQIKRAIEKMLEGIPSLQERSFESAPIEGMTSPGIKALKALVDESFVMRIALAQCVKEEFGESLEGDRERARAFSTLFELAAIPIVYGFDFEAEEQYLQVQSAFEKLSKCLRVWDITGERRSANEDVVCFSDETLVRVAVQVNTEGLRFIKSEYPPFRFQNANGGDLYLYPAFALVLKPDSMDFAIIEVNDLAFSFGTMNFIETDGRQIPYGWISLKSATGLNERFMFSDCERTTGFGRLMTAYLERVCA